MPRLNLWKTRPPYYFMLEVLSKKGDMTDDNFYDLFVGEYEDLGFKDFNRQLLDLEVSGKIRVSSLARGKRLIHMVKQ
jgi:hypothetical protein